MTAIPPVRIRPIEPEDLELVYAIENDPSLWDTTSSDAPYSRHVLRKYLSSMRPVSEIQELRMAIEVGEKGTSRTIGMIDLTDIDFINAKAEVGITLLHNEREHGYGTRALHLVARIAQERLRLHQLYALISERNEHAIKTFINAGYQHIADLPEWHYHDKGYETVRLLQKIL